MRLSVVLVAQQLAQESGYHSYSTFSAAFRQRMHKDALIQGLL